MLMVNKIQYLTVEMVRMNNGKELIEGQLDGEFNFKSDNKAQTVEISGKLKLGVKVNDTIPKLKVDPFTVHQLTRR